MLCSLGPTYPTVNQISWEERKGVIRTIPICPRVVWVHSLLQLFGRRHVTPIKIAGHGRVQEQWCFYTIFPDRNRDNDRGESLQGLLKMHLQCIIKIQQKGLQNDLPQRSP